MGFSSILVAIAIAETLIVLTLAVYTLTLMIISIYFCIRYRKIVKKRQEKMEEGFYSKNKEKREVNI